jgi:sigma-B regulation protein RsbU (phosphoserine phosphatase)
MSVPMDRVLSEATRRIRELDPQPSLRGFLITTARILLEATGARACGTVARYPGAARELVQFVPALGDVIERVRFLDSEQRGEALRVPPEHRGDRRFHSCDLEDLARESGFSCSRVVWAPVTPRREPVAWVELADPDPSRLADHEPLRALFDAVGVSYELALLYSRLRQERLEAHLLREAGQELARTLDLTVLLNAILDFLHEIVPYDAAAIYLLGDAGLDVVNQSVRGYSAEALDVVHLKVGQGISGWVARTGQPAIVPVVAQDARYLPARAETRSEMVAPLKSGGRVIGVFNVESDHERAYTTRDLELLEAFAGQAAAALERARLLSEEEAARLIQQELSIARRIQRRFLPPITPALHERGIGARSLSSKEVSGDSYDLVSLPDGGLAFSIADVSGKGMPASLIMAGLHAAFRLAVSEDPDPAAVCSRVNRFLAESLSPSEFVTAVFAVLDPASSTVRYCIGGHNPPLLMRRDGTAQWLASGGLLLGVFAGAPYDAQETTLEPGDVLLLYTDGVTEAWHPVLDEFGSERLEQTVRDHREYDAQEICNAVVREARRFVEGSLQDDMTLLAVKGVERG